ncbi:MAG: class I SAM-dependent methyltransferase, partial [Candidatus Dormibacteraeota bacterium]|nr:class I SAM-dependent methyltransferase [Candidatus Dormibacteraeota bacterium]
MRRSRGPYLFPRHPREIDRLDVQHYAFQGTAGSNFLAPVDTPRRVLDSGSGTGQWGFEVSQQFPAALVVGVDLVPGKPQRPPRYRSVRANLLQGLPFCDATFDFVHQRLMVPAIPPRAWPHLVRDLVRVTRPGGWLELVEVPWEADQAGPATERLLELLREFSASRGLDRRRTVFESVDRYLRDAGLKDVVRREIALRCGDWGGDAGALVASNMRAAFTRVCEVLQSRSLLREEEARALIQQSQDECR